MQALSDLMKLIESGEHGSPFQEIQHPKKRAFLSAYVLTAHKGRAAEAVGIDLSTTYKPTWVGDEEFQAALARARVMSGDALEAEVIRRGVHGIEEPVLYQGEVVEYIRRYSDNLLMFQTKSVRPEYRERLEVRGTLAHIDFNRLSDDQLARIAAGEHVLSVLGTATQPVAALPPAVSDDTDSAPDRQELRE